jgi:hypothetical protein
MLKQVLFALKEGVPLNLNTKYPQSMLKKDLLTVIVLDLVSQVRDVVLVMCIFSSGKPQGAGILERGVFGEGDGRGEISLRATWDQGGQDPIAARRVLSK